MAEPSEDVHYHLELTPAQLKITHTALKSLLDDFGHEEGEVVRVIGRCSTSCRTSTPSARSRWTRSCGAARISLGGEQLAGPVCVRLPASVLALVHRLVGTGDQLAGLVVERLALGVAGAGIDAVFRQSSLEPDRERLESRVGGLGT